MNRINSEALSPHLEVALMMAPADTLNALLDSDRYRRLRAIARLADHLVQRLQCFDIVMADESGPEVSPDQQPHLAGCE